MGEHKNSRIKTNASIEFVVHFANFENARSLYVQEACQ